LLGFGSPLGYALELPTDFGNALLEPLLLEVGNALLEPTDFGNAFELFILIFFLIDCY